MKTKGKKVNVRQFTFDFWDKVIVEQAIGTSAELPEVARVMAAITAVAEKIGGVNAKQN